MEAGATLYITLKHFIWLNGQLFIDVSYNAICYHHSRLSFVNVNIILLYYLMANSLNKNKKTGDRFNVSKRLDLHYTDRIHVVYAICLNMRFKYVLPYEWLQPLHIIEIKIKRNKKSVHLLFFKFRLVVWQYLKYVWHIWTEIESYFRKSVKSTDVKLLAKLQQMFRHFCCQMQYQSYCKEMNQIKCGSPHFTG